MKFNFSQRFPLVGKGGKTVWHPPSGTGIGMLTQVVRPPFQELANRVHDVKDYHVGAPVSKFKLELVFTRLPGANRQAPASELLRHLLCR